jgi:hypothetical protein
MILSKRFQQTVFAGAAPGAVDDKLRAVRALGNTGSLGAVNLTVNVSGTTYTTINSIDFSVPLYATNVFAWALVQGTQTIGAGSGNIGMQLDGIFPSSWGYGNMQFQGDHVGSGVGTTIGPITLITIWPLVQQGGHTLSVVGNTSGAGTTFQDSGFPNFILLGG